MERSSIVHLKIPCLVLAGTIAATALALGFTRASAEPRAASPAPPRAEGAAAFDATVARRMAVADLQRRLAAGEKVVLIDSRPPGSAKIKGAVNLSFGGLAAWAKEQPKGTLIVTYCA